MSTHVSKNLFIDDANKLFNLLFAGGGEKIIVVNNAGEIAAIYNTADEFVAVPATLTSPGIPGQKAWAAPFLYYCVDFNLWIRFLAEGSNYSIQELYVAIPTSPTSAGAQGQRAYDATNSMMYECVQNNIWIRYPITKTW